jgi:TolB-like protein
MTMSERRPDAAGAPSVDEVRGALDRMLASEVFRGSPQLAAFLRYVVEATLRGEADRIKGYTIAIEALGRDDTFDPQTDPIVRVEAARLRRAINRYYAGAEGGQTVQIELPLGSYVPGFRRVAMAGRRRVSFLVPRLDWGRIMSGAALVLIGAAIYAGFDFWFDFNTPNPQTTYGVPPARAQTDAARRNAFPVVLVGPVEAIGPHASATPLAATLGAKLRDALARFDEIQVVTERPASPGEPGRATPPGYRLSASLEAYEDGTFSLTVRLIDSGDASVAYARVFNHLAWAGDLFGVEDAIVRELSATLAQPYGIIHANERGKRAGTAADTPRYRCLMLAYDYWRDYDPALHARARECLERLIEADATFAIGYAALAPLVLEEYANGVNPRPGEAPLPRALQLARRAVELKPGSARAHQALLDVHVMRGDETMALQAGEKAVLLNPYDPEIVADYGARLLSLGEREKGGRLLHEAAAASAARPAWHDFFLFLTAYLADDRSGAARYAALITSNTYPLGLVARVLVAASAGDEDARRQLIDRLVVVRPSWRGDPRRELKKFFSSEAIVERLAVDLARAGLGATN